MRCAGSHMLKSVLDANEVQEYMIGYIYMDLRIHSPKALDCLRSVSCRLPDNLYHRHAQL